MPPTSTAPDLTALVEWLCAQLDEDERIARSTGGVTYLDWADGGWVEAAAPTTGWKSPGDDGRYVGTIRLAEDRAHITTHDPARVLREIDAKRQIVERYVWLREHGDTGGTAWVLRLLALPYADRPGYREEWRP